MKKFGFAKVFSLVLCLACFSCNHGHTEPSNVDENIIDDGIIFEDGYAIAKITNGSVENIENNTSHSDLEVRSELEYLIKQEPLVNGTVTVRYGASSECVHDHDDDIVTRAGSKEKVEHKCAFEPIFYQKKEHKHSTGFWPWENTKCIVEKYKWKCTICNKIISHERHSYQE